MAAIFWVTFLATFARVMSTHFCPEGFSDDTTTDPLFCARTLASASTFAQAFRECFQANISARMVTVDEIKKLDAGKLNTTQLNIYHVNAIKDARDGVWKQIAGPASLEQANFTDFPGFPTTSGGAGNTLVWVAQAPTRLFPINFGLSILRNVNFQPLCVAPKIEVTPCSPEPNCCGNGVCTNGQCVCNAGYRTEENCCCKDSKMTVVFKDKVDMSLLVGIQVTYKSDDNVAQTVFTNEQGQIVITGCAGKKKSFIVDGFCKATKITTEEGMKTVEVQVLRSTKLVFSVVDALTSLPVNKAALKSDKSPDKETNVNGNVICESCQGFNDEFRLTQNKYCDNSLPVNVKGKDELAIVPMYPLITGKIIVTDVKKVPIRQAKLNVPKASVTGKNTNVNGVALFRSCYGFYGEFNVKNDGFCTFKSNIFLNQSPRVTINLELKREAKLEVVVRDDKTGETKDGIQIKARKVGTARFKTVTTDANGVATFEKSPACEEEDVEVVAGLDNGAPCSGSYIFHRLNSGTNRVTFYVTCT